VKNVLDVCAPGGGYALGSGNSAANYLKVENYKMMLQEGFSYKY
jgi:uroporphyrinogen decarboxylase